MPFAGAAIQQQQPPQSMKPWPQGLGPQLVEHMPVLLVPAAAVAPALPAAAPDPPLAVSPAVPLVAPALPPLDPVVPLSELHAASPTVDDAPVTTST